MTSTLEELNNYKFLLFPVFIIFLPILFLFWIYSVGYHWGEYNDWNYEQELEKRNKI